MKKIITIAKKTLKFMSVIAFVGFIGSCDKKDDSTLWDDGAAATLVSIEPTSALVGKEVIINGKYFSSKANNTVSFNGLDAEITSANISTITAIMPIGATDGNITVTSDGLVSNGLPYTVVQPIIPTITSIDPTAGKIGQTVIITGTDFSTTPAENQVSFNGAAATVTASTTTTITTTVPAGATTGNVTVTRDEESNGVLFTVSVSYTVTVDITEEINDVEEASSTGMVDWESSDLELGEFDTTGDPDYGLQAIGLRYPGISVPTGANILSASIQFTCDNTGADPVQLTIYGENIGNSEPFVADLQYTVTGRTKTTENAVWDIPEWINTGDDGLAQKTVDLAAIVQAIVDRGDWASGNSLSFIMLHSGPSIGVTSSSGGREAEAGPGSDSATLTIVYELMTK